MPFERTQMGSPFYGYKQFRRLARPEASGKALAQMGALGASIGKTVADNQEAQAKRDATNDIINDSINPDKMTHQAAYAWTVAANQAEVQWNESKTQIDSGVFDDVDPDEFQQHLKSLHKSFSEDWAKNPHGGPATASYNEFTLKNEPSLVAAQAGKFRINLGEKQTVALQGRISAMSENPAHTVEDYEAAVESTEFSLVDSTGRLSALLLGMQKQVSSTGQMETLRALNKKYAFDTDPTLSSKYNTIIAKGEKAGRDQNKQNRSNLLDSVYKLQAEGGLTLKYYNDMIKDNPQYKDENGEDILSEKEFVRMMWAGKNNNDRKGKTDSVIDRMKRNIPTPGATKKDVQAGYDAIRQEAEQVENADRYTVAERVGQAVSASAQQDQYMQDIASSWSGIKPILPDGEINPQFENLHTELKSFRRGVSNDVKFFKHLDEESSFAFHYIEKAMKGSAEGMDDRIKNAYNALQLKQDKKAAGDLQVYHTLDADMKEIVTDAIDDQYSWWADLPLFGDKMGEEFDTGVNAKVSRWVLERLNMGLMVPSTMDAQIQEYLSKNYSVVQGTVQYTGGISPEILTGGADADETIKGYLEGPGSNLTESFSGDTKIDFNMESGTIDITDTESTESVPVKIPFGVLQRYDEAKRLAVDYFGESLDEDSIKAHYAPPTAQELDTTGFPRYPQIVTGEPDKPNLLDERDQYWKNKQMELNQEYFSKYVDVQVREEFAPYADDWAKMDPVDRTLARSRTMNALTKEADVTTEFFKNYSKLVNEEFFSTFAQGQTSGLTPTFDTSGYEATEFLKQFNNEVGLKIDFGFISKLEGGNQTTGYVPTKDGKAIGKSGVTIGVGVDLGSKDIKYFKNTGVSTELINKISPYFGLKGDAAIKVAKDLKLTKGETTILTNAVKSTEAKSLEKAFNKASGVDFSNVGKEWQTIIASLWYQYGGAGIKKTQFWKQVVKQDWAAAEKNLRDFGDKYSTRRNKEADLLK